MSAKKIHLINPRTDEAVTLCGLKKVKLGQITIHTVDATCPKCLKIRSSHEGSLFSMPDQ